MAMNPNLPVFDAQRRNQQAQGTVPTIHPHSADEAGIALFNLGAGSSTGGDTHNLALLQVQQRNLAFTTRENAQRSVMEVLARHNTTNDGTPDTSENSEKRKREEENVEPKTKKQRSSSNEINAPANVDDSGPTPVPPSEEGLSFFNDSDVLSGRGGGTNVHPGNRHFRDLINLHRRSYLKARKNDKPAISRAIVRNIRENNGRFLKREEKTGLWYEIGDDAAREKTSQALRQRAPEMRKILFESEREQARQEAEEQIRQQQQLLASGFSGQPTDLASLGPNFNIAGLNSGLNPGLNPMLGQQPTNPMLNPILAMQMNKQSFGGPMPNLQNDPYSMSQNLMTAALLGGGINRFTPNGA
mmetsp:Transcript_37781/g.43159  ORF Transcript_37781/g.43159 Transcript_37781/m.43159 type:complete len:358 (+) Transcript_37781:53-1126(+)|eukprot:CAMPEP_0194150178 /NCGR_PEP_ID=MMETSP0152-20130528/41884_1 /TAXON_ID=1049557 /ORGANISM="Thalassiothrix antarctica, Strain L6-D1" /LENGTH=357 /DNA_ID=CAMNT_0038852905 /DNA_START=42 /DNA_END=1115 /DNA_ORIENTATION=-